METKIINNNDYKLIKKVGKGSFAVCWLVEKNNNQYVVKISKKNNEHLSNEIKILKKIKENENVINIIDVLNFNNKLSFIMPQMDLTLLDILHNKYENGLPQPLLKNITKQILNGLLFIHNNDIIHSDLKPENILIKLNGNDINVKICDFGTSFYTDDIDICNIGTIEYNAPEVIIQTNLTKDMDIWSFGCIVFEMATGEYLFDPSSYFNEIIGNINSDSEASEGSEASETNNKTGKASKGSESSNDSGSSEASESSDSEASGASNTSEASGSSNETDDNGCNHMLLCLIESCIGKMPKYIQKRGDNSDEYFHRAGMIRNKPTFINDKTIFEILVKEYNIDEKFANELSEFLKPIFIYDIDKRAKAEDLLISSFLN